MTAELPGPGIDGRRPSEECQPVVVRTPLQTSCAGRRSEHSLGADDLHDGGVSVPAEGRLQKSVHQLRLLGVQVADSNAVALESKYPGRQVGPVGPQWRIESYTAVDRCSDVSPSRKAFAASTATDAAAPAVSSGAGSAVVGVDVRSSVTLKPETRPMAHRTCRRGTRQEPSSLEPQRLLL